MDSQTLPETECAVVEAPVVVETPRAAGAETICLAVKLNKIGQNRKVPADDVEVDADPTAIHVSKTILDSPEIREIKRLYSQVRSYLKPPRAMPSLLKGGIYVISPADVVEIDATIDAYEVQLLGLVDALIARFPEIIQEDKERLKIKVAGLERSVFQETDYKSPKEVREAFSLEKRWLALDVPKAMRTISQAIFAKEQEKSAAWAVAAKEKAAGILIAELNDTLDTLIKRMNGETRDGTKSTKKLKVSEKQLGRFDDFLATFKVRVAGFSDSPDLQELVSRAQAVVNETPLDDLNGTMKEAARVKFEAIKASVESYLVVKPKRMIDLDLDTPPAAADAN